MWITIPEEDSNGYYSALSLSALRKETRNGPSYRGKLHLVARGKKAICGADGSNYYWSVDVVDRDMDILPESGSSIQVPLEGLKDRFCRNCLETFKRNARADALDIIALMAGARYEKQKALRWEHVSQANPTVQERLQQMLDQYDGQLVIGLPGVPKTQAIIEYGKEYGKGDKMAATTNTVIVNVCIEFNLDEVALQDVAAAIDEIQQAAGNYGKFEECTLTSRLPLQIDLGY